MRKQIKITPEKELVALLLDLPWTYVIEKIGGRYIITTKEWPDLYTTHTVKDKAIELYKKHLGEELLAAICNKEAITVPCVGEIRMTLTPKENQT